jgi:serine/threonine protein kinase
MVSRLGRYALLNHLASGGMADVFLARSDGIEGFERHVVIKRIRPELGRDLRFIKMFLDEARVAATLHHQNILQVYDIGEADGEYFIAMEYVHGEDVRRLLSNAARRRTHIPIRYVLSILSSAAAGLHHAHDQRASDGRPLEIVHRDVSPSNILVGYDGSIKLLDFGIATASTLQETRSGALKGKLAYMSPEQCRGLKVDRRTDVYSLGAVLYELSTTTRMIEGGNDYQVMEQIATGRIAPPRSRRPDLPDELSDIILRALASDREERFASGEEFRFALDSFAASAGLTSTSAALQQFMQQQFGRPPEPWIDLPAAPEIDLGRLPPIDTNFDGAHFGSNNSWSDPPRSRRESGASDLRRAAELRQASGQLALSSSDIGVRSTPGTPALGAHEPAVKSSRLSGRGLLLLAGTVVGAVIATWLVATWPHSHPITVPPAPAVAPSQVAAALPAAAAPVAPAAAPVVVAPPPDAEALEAASAPDASATVHRADAPARKPDKPDKPDKPEVVATRRTRAVDPAATRAALPIDAPGRAKPDHPVRVAASDPPPHAETALAEVERPAPPSTPAPVPPPTPVAPPPAPARPAAPPVAQTVSPTTLEANRIAGDRTIAPDPVTIDALARTGEDKLVSTYKICVTTEGAVESVTQLKSSGYAAYDEKIRDAIRKEWRYRPYLVDGKPQPVCTGVRFVFALHP